MIDTGDVTQLGGDVGMKPEHVRTYYTLLCKESADDGRRTMNGYPPESSLRRQPAFREAWRLFKAGTPEKLSIGAQGVMINMELSMVATVNPPEPLFDLNPFKINVLCFCIISIFCWVGFSFLLVASHAF